MPNPPDDYFVAEMNQPSAWNKISNINGGSGGDVTLTITYATEIAGTKSLYVNSEITRLTQVNFPPTANWTTFVESDPITITLNAGTSNYIMLKHESDDGHDGVNIDKYTVSSL